ncbi:hypothetical protein TNCV_5075871 [Trichonephila clavipes]|uniref:Uncharacterized protein n=1 Tax=Trichonephila clavipes TaxID=2585209 RepID=A0A8X6RYH1_TRICX|nr:hypothetical protein TNCV_5075871 [Trichonephila clavipes]
MSKGANRGTCIPDGREVPGPQKNLKMYLGQGLQRVLRRPRRSPIAIWSRKHLFPNVNGHFSIVGSGKPS